MSWKTHLVSILCPGGRAPPSWVVVLSNEASRDSFFSMRPELPVGFGVHPWDEVSIGPKSGLVKRLMIPV